MPLIPRMADSVTPALIPEIFRVQPNGVLAYGNGLYTWPDATVDSFPRHVSIATQPLRVDPQAWKARELDVERFDATPADVPPFYTARKTNLGRSAQVIAYCDRSTVRAVMVAMVDRLGSAAAGSLLWHIATLDGRKWTPAQLADDLATNWAVQVRPAQIWAIQWLPAGTYDESAVYGDPAWSTT